MKSHLLTTQQQQHKKGVLWHLAICCCINADRWKQDKHDFQTHFATAGACLWVNGTEIMSLITIHSLYISILTLL